MGTDRARAGLGEALGKAPPKGVVAALEERELADLTRAVTTADARQAQELDAAIEGALGGIPRLLRGPLRKILLG